jgi:hypothetical protein
MKRHRIQGVTYALVTVLFLGVSAIATQSGNAQERAATSPAEADAQITLLLTKVETILAQDAPNADEFAQLLIAAQVLLPPASPVGRKRVADLPAVLNKLAEEQRANGRSEKAMNYEIYARVAKDFLKPNIDMPRQEPPVPVPAPVTMPPRENRALLERGDYMLGLGNVVAARSLYERAVDLGTGVAALKLGDTYDSEFLTKLNLRGIKPDPAMAEKWYRKAQEMNVPQAKERLNTSEAHRLAEGSKQ